MPGKKAAPAGNSARRDKFAAHLRIEILSVGKNRARVRLAVRPCFMNGVGLVHGGIIFSLADYAFALAANAGGDAGLAVDTQIHFIRAALPSDTLYAYARLVSRSRRLGTYRVDVTNRDGAILACTQSMAYFTQRGACASRRQRGDPERREGL